MSVLVLYAIMGLITAFSMTVFLFVKNADDGVIEYALPTISGVFWPVVLPLSLAVGTVWGMHSLARKAANRIKAKRK